MQQESLLKSGGYPFRIFMLLFLALLVNLPLPAPASASDPVSNEKIVIPSIGVESAITFVPLGYRDGNYEWLIDPWESHVGYFEGTAPIGYGSNTLLGAHSTMPDGSLGLFYELDKVQRGDEIIVFQGDAKLLYVVVETGSVSQYKTGIALPSRTERLTIITCFVGDNNRRTVVVAERIG